MKHKLPAPKAPPAPECNLTNAEPPPRLAVATKEHKRKRDTPFWSMSLRDLKDGGTIAEYVSCKDQEPHHEMPIQRGETRRTILFSHYNVITLESSDFKAKHLICVLSLYSLIFSLTDLMVPSSQPSKSKTKYVSTSSPSSWFLSLTRSF